MPPTSPNPIKATCRTGISFMTTPRISIALSKAIRLVA
jgi:hypothetical protein